MGLVPLVGIQAAQANGQGLKAAAAHRVDFLCVFLHLRFIFYRQLFHGAPVVRVDLSWMTFWVCPRCLFICVYLFRYQVLSAVVDGPGTRTEIGSMYEIGPCWRPVTFPGVHTYSGSCVYARCGFTIEISRAAGLGHYQGLCEAARVAGLYPTISIEDDIGQTYGVDWPEMAARWRAGDQAARLTEVPTYLYRYLGLCKFKDRQGGKAAGRAGPLHHMPCNSTS